MAGPVTDPRAGLLRQRYHTLFSDPPLPVPVDRIAEDLLGLQVERDTTLTDVSGALYPLARRVVVNANEADTRQRFTLAHEVGHWICQCLTGRSAPVFCRLQDLAASTDRSLEREANVFAAELMLPESEVRAAFAEESDIGRVAARFGVSPLAMQWRLYSFSLADRPPT